MSMAETRSNSISLTLDRSFVRGVILALVGGVVLALTGAFGMNQTPLWFRLVYWEPVMLMGALWGHFCSQVLERFIDLDRRPWLMATVLTLVISGPLSVAVWAVTTRFFDDDRMLELSRLPDFLIPVMVVTGVFCALNVMLARTPVQ